MIYSNILINFALITVCLAITSPGINVSSGKFESKKSNSNENTYITKIDGGVDAKANEGLWNVAILGGLNTDFNNGAIIAPNYILTNGVFCSYLKNMVNRTLTIKYGGTNRTNLTYSTQNIKTILHPNFTNEANNITYNYCILRLKDPVHISTKVNIIPIAKRRPTPGTKVNLTSWGISNGSLSNKLELGTFEILSKAECQKKYYWEKISDDQICAQAQNVSTCYDDWGAPLVVNGELVGIVSTVAGCYSQTPTVYADTVFVRDWIESTINNGLINTTTASPTKSSSRPNTTTTGIPTTTSKPTISTSRHSTSSTSSTTKGI